MIASADKESMRKPTRGGGDNKYRKVRGIGEYSRNRQIQVERKVSNADGCLRSGWGKKKMGFIPESEDRSRYNLESYKFMLDAPFEISNKCCNVMKKDPIHKYAKETGRMPITAQMASESRLRTQKWLQNGCNAFHTNNPISNPMSFWTEQDILRYIKDRNLPICSVYGEVVSDDEETGQMQLFDMDRPLHCTGCQRTGCTLCGFGASIKGDDRFLRLKETHPGMYGLLDKVTNSGYTMRQAIEWINEHSNKIIRI